jgi:hypothetical protein
MSQSEALCSRWDKLCDLHLPVSLEVWRLSRHGRMNEPAQGWKLHVAATILDACDVLQIIAPVLDAQDVQYKAPSSLDELLKINSGLHYGYRQVGKFITIYPRESSLAVSLAQVLHDLTKDFAKISVPFDNQYCPRSAIFYRYGAFSRMESRNTEGRKVLLINDSNGNSVEDDRFVVKPDWIPHTFPPKATSENNSFAGTPLGTNYLIYGAIKQRGKGGTYRAVDLTEKRPRLCIVKEGRRHGEVAWNGRDGYDLAKNEFYVLNELRQKYEDVPMVRDCFEVHGSFYFVMEYIEGKSLKHHMDTRCRRYRIEEILQFAVAIAEIIKNIHNAGWIWNDCKPANLIITKGKKLRPVDFEGAYRIHTQSPFEWRTKAFSGAGFNGTEGTYSDLYSLGAVLYFLITGQLVNPDRFVSIAKLRRNIPSDLATVVESLLFDPTSSLEKTIIILRALLNAQKRIVGVAKDSRSSLVQRTGDPGVVRRRLDR